MKKIIYAALFSMFATAASAELAFVNAGSEDGVFKQMFDIIGTEVDHTFVQANTPINATAHFNSNSAFTVWSSEWPSNTEIETPVIDENTLVALLTYDTLMCSREFTSFEDMAGKTIKVATWGSAAADKFLNKLGEKHSVDFVVVPYDGSGSATKGYIAGDADTVFTITSKQTAIEEDTASNCFAFSAAGDLDFRFVDAMITVNAEAAQTQELRNVVESVSNETQWKDAFAGSTTLVANEENSAELLDIYNVAIENFAQ